MVQILKDRNKPWFKSFREDKTGWVVGLPDSSFIKNQVASVSDIIDSVQFDSSVVLYWDKCADLLTDKDTKDILSRTFGVDFLNYVTDITYFFSKSKLKCKLPGTNKSCFVNFKFWKITFSSINYAKIFLSDSKRWNEINIVRPLCMSIKDIRRSF